MNTRYLTLAIFVTVTLSALVGLAWTLGALPKGGKTYHLRLADAGGLVEGNAVRIAGVQVGKIQRMDIDGNEALLELRVDSRHKIFADVCASDQIKGMLGEKFLQLRQGKAGTELESGGAITCVDRSVDMGRALNALGGVIDSEEALFPIAVRIMKRLDSLTAVLDAELAPQDGAAGAGAPGTGGSARQRIDRILGETERLLVNVNEVIEENRDDARASLAATRALLENPKLTRTIDHVERLAGMLDREAPGLVASGKRLLADGERLLGDVEAKLKALDEEKIRKMMADGEAALANVRKLSADFRDLAKTTTPLLNDLKTIAQRAAQINEKVIRQFTQIEGLTVHFIGPSPSAKRAYNQLSEK